MTVPPLPPYCASIMRKKKTAPQADYLTQPITRKILPQRYHILFRYHLSRRSLRCGACHFLTSALTIILLTTWLRPRNIMMPPSTCTSSGPPVQHRVWHARETYLSPVALHLNPPCCVCRLLQENQPIAQRYFSLKARSHGLSIVDRVSHSRS